MIAAINGLCMGGGFELTLACDIRIAGRDVTAIGLPETRVGIFPGGGGTQRLPRVIGEARALEMILRGRVAGGRGALELGLVHEMADDPLARALEIAAEFAARPAEGLAYAKRLTRAALDRPLSEGLADERASFGEVVRMPSAIAAMKASLASAPLGTREPSSGPLRARFGLRPSRLRTLPRAGGSASSAPSATSATAPRFRSPRPWGP